MQWNRKCTKSVFVTPLRLSPEKAIEIGDRLRSELNYNDFQKKGDKMPSPSIKTIKELIFYQYAKIIADSSGFSKSNFKFVMSCVNKLKKDEINMSSITRELKMQIGSTEKKCEYCGNPDNLSWDHIIPQSKGGPDTADNLILCCKSCNSSKGSKGLYEWFGLDNKDQLQRIVAGKYLKLLFDLHEKNGTLEDGAKNVLCLERVLRD